MAISCTAWVADCAQSAEKPAIELAEAFQPGDLADDEVLVKVQYSSINYKDALALTATGSILRSRGKIVPGIDLTGTVAESKSQNFKPGDAVIATGWGLGERFDGGFAEYCRLKDWMLVMRPPELTAERAMAAGTAGLTAMLAIIELENAKCLRPESSLLVTSAGGGLGSIAVALLAGMQQQVVAVSRSQNRAYLATLGAKDMIEREEFIADIKPLSKQQWDGAIDTAGGKMLAALLPQMKHNAAAVSCGLTAGADLATTVMPFILRGVRLIGINSVEVAAEKRMQAWQRISDLRAHLNALKVEVVQLDQVRNAAERLMRSAVQGRIIVKIAG